MKSSYFEYLIDRHIDIKKYGYKYVYGKYYDYLIEIMINRRK